VPAPYPRTGGAHGLSTYFATSLLLLSIMHEENIDILSDICLKIILRIFLYRVQHNVISVSDVMWCDVSIKEIRVIYPKYQLMKHFELVNATETINFSCLWVNCVKTMDCSWLTGLFTSVTCCKPAECRLGNCYLWCRCLRATRGRYGQPTCLNWN